MERRTLMGLIALGLLVQPGAQDEERVEPEESRAPEPRLDPYRAEIEDEPSTPWPRRRGRRRRR